MASKTIGWIKLLLFVFSIVFVVWFLFTLYSWSEPLKNYFSFVGSWESYVVLFLLILIIKFVLEKLLKWESHAFFKRRR